MTVGELRALLEFADDNMKVYTPTNVSNTWGAAQAQFEFMVESGFTQKWRSLADPEDSVDNEVGLVIW